MKSMKQLAQLALDCQNASNLSGIVHSFSSVMTDLRSHLDKLPGFGTEKMNKHPICVLFVTQFAFLTEVSPTGCESMELYRQCYEWAKAQSESETLIPVLDTI